MLLVLVYEAYSALGRESVGEESFGVFICDGEVSLVDDVHAN